MNIDRFIKDERRQRSACCDARIHIVYKTVTSVRTAVVYNCLSCDRLHVVDGRDEEEVVYELDPDPDLCHDARRNGDYDDR